MSVRTPAEMHVGVCECVARVCVSVSSRGQAGGAVGRGIDSLWRMGRASACCSLSNLGPSLEVSWGSLGFQASPKLLLGEGSQAGLRGCSGHLPRLISGLTPALLSPDFPPCG